MILLALLPANASSLDLLEVGGVYGTPGATNASATWWNPAGLAAGRGTRFMLEGAPLIAKVSIDRTNPNYTYDPDAEFGPETADYGGSAEYRRSTIVPFAGVASDLGQKGLGVGFSISVPHGRGAAGDPDQVTRHHLVDGGNLALYAQVAAAYQIKDRISFGISGAYVASQYKSDLYSETASGLSDGLQEISDRVYYSDTVLEDSNYATRATSGTLTDSALTFGVGVRVEASEKVSVNLAYRHGFRVDHTGTTELQFDCPTPDDFWGGIGSQARGICNSLLTADMSVGYNLPSRLHGSVTYQPLETLRLELMGGFVGWSTFTDYDIVFDVDPSSVPLDRPEQQEETAAAISVDKQWARDNRDSFWFALDGKVKVDPRVELGGRVLYDRAAVPTNVLGPNNYDANTLGVTAMVAGQITKNLGVGLSAGHYFAANRTVTDSAWGLTIDGDRNAPRYFYPEMNGTFRSSITRLGLTVQFAFGAPDA